MKTLRWRELCAQGERLHIATIEGGKVRSTAMHRHDFYECFLVLGGKGEHVLLSGTEPLRVNHLYFIRPEHSHTVVGQADLVFLNIACEAGVFEKTLALSDLLSECWARSDSVGHRGLSPDQSLALRSCVDDIAGEYSRENAAWLMLSLARILDHPVSRKYLHNAMPEWMAEGLHRAMNHQILRQGVPGLIAVMGRSREHVTRSFRKYLRLTPTEWLNQERVEYAKQLLTTTRLSILEIALECGYESPSHFHKCFRQQCDTTPLKYRERLKRVQA